MQIGGKQVISHPAPRVFAALRDQQAVLAARYLPNIESVEVLEREDRPPTVRLYNRWQGRSDDVARVIRPFVSREMMSWLDDATWNEETLSCAWRIHSARAKEVFECSGETHIIAQDGASSLFELKGDLHVHPEKVPGVPGFLARTVREPIEKFVAGLLSPNLTMMAQAVQRFLDEAAR